MRRFAMMLAALPTLALAEFDTLTQAQCEAALQLPQQATGSPITGTVTVEGGACVITDFAFELPDASRIAFVVDRVALSARGMQRLLAMEAPLQAAVLDIDGIRIRTVTGFPEIDYLMSVQQARNVIDADVSVSWDPETRQLEMEQFEVRFPYDQRVFAAFVAENADLSSFAAMEASMMQIAVTDLTLEMTSYGLFEAYVAPALINVFIGGAEDPEAEVRLLQGQAVGALRALPPGLWTPGSREALEAVIQDLPIPNGTVAVHVDADPGIGAGRAAPFMLMGAPEGIEDVWPALGGIEIEATYDRVPLE